MVARWRPNAVALLTSEALRWGVPRTILHCARGDAHYLEGAVTTFTAAAEVTASTRVASAQVTGLLVYRHPPLPRPHGPSTRRVPDPSLAEDAVAVTSPIWNLVRWRLRQAVSRPTPCTATRRAARTALAT